MSEPADDCVFCQIIAGTIPADVLARNEHAVSFKDLHPQAPFHALVVPLAHHDNAAASRSGRPRDPRPRRLPRRPGRPRVRQRALPPDRQHRTRRRADRLPHPLPRPGRNARHDRAAGVSAVRGTLAAVLASGLLALSACGGGAGEPDADRSATQPTSSTSPSADEGADEAADAGHGGHYAEPAKSRPLREGETRTTIAMPGADTPLRRPTAPAPTTTAASCSTPA